MSWLPQAPRMAARPSRKAMPTRILSSGRVRGAAVIVAVVMVACILVLTADWRRILGEIKPGSQAL